ncbi:hypothetical protein T484DRAFT_1914541 [Baffinella frigidus]|nr:hypothetical protein T484DRAFT_1914541 [Cryptophyta sp. CCMP2293]
MVKEHVDAVEIITTHLAAMVKEHVDAVEIITTHLAAVTDSLASTSLLLEAKAGDKCGTPETDSGVPEKADKVREEWEQAEVELESIRKMLVWAADTGYSKWHNA